MLIDKNIVLSVVNESAKKIPDDEWCDSCSWLFDMISNGIEDISDKKQNTDDEILISVVNDFSPTPGARYKNESKFSGEEFREKILFPKFKEALANNKTLVVNLDGAYGYGTGFLDEAFGGLIRNNRVSLTEIWKHLAFVTKEEPGLEEEIINYCKDATKFVRKNNV